MESPGISAKQGKRPGLQLPRKVKKEPAEELGSGICTSNLCSYHPMVTIHLILGVQLALALQSCSWELTVCDSDKTERLLTACGKEGYELDVQALRAANSERVTTASV